MSDAVMAKPRFNGTSAEEFVGRLFLQGIAANCTDLSVTFLEPFQFPRPGTPAWGSFNRRRAELIRRKIRSRLSEREEEELEWLQSETLAAVDREFPRSPVDIVAITELEKRLKAMQDLEKQ